MANLSRKDHIVPLSPAEEELHQNAGLTLGHEQPGEEWPEEKELTESQPCPIPRLRDWRQG